MTLYAAYVILLSLALGIIQVSGTCQFPSQFQNVKWFSRYDLNYGIRYWHKFDATNMIHTREGANGGFLKPVMPCIDGSGTATSFYTYIKYLNLMSTCFNFNYQGNILLTSEGIPGGAKPKTAATCQQAIKSNSDKQLWIADPFQNKSCPFPPGTYQAVYSQDSTSNANKCAGDPNSKATVSGEYLELSTCYSGPDAYATPFKRTLKCVQSFDGSVIDKSANGKVLVLASEPDSQNKTRFYCARYKEEAGKIFLSLDVSPKNDRKTMCRYDAKYNSVGTKTATTKFVAFTLSEREATTAEPTTIELPTTEPPTTSADMSPCDKNPCKNGGTCLEIGTKYNCTCAQGFSGQQCQLEQASTGKLSRNDLILLVILLILLAAIIFVSVCVAVFICQTRRKKKEDKLLKNATDPQDGDGYSGKPSWYPSYKSTK